MTKITPRSTDMITTTTNTINSHPRTQKRKETTPSHATTTITTAVIKDSSMPQITTSNHSPIETDPAPSMGNPQETIHTNNPLTIQPSPQYNKYLIYNTNNNTPGTTNNTPLYFNKYTRRLKDKSKSQKRKIRKK